MKEEFFEVFNIVSVEPFDENAIDLDVNKQLEKQEKLHIC